MRSILLGYSSFITHEMPKFDLSW